MTVQLSANLWLLEIVGGPYDGDHMLYRPGSGQRQVPTFAGGSLVRGLVGTECVWLWVPDDDEDEED